MITKQSKIKPKSYSLLILLLLSLEAITAPLRTSTILPSTIDKSLTWTRDTVPPVADTIPASARARKDSSGALIDKVDTLNVRLSKDSMSAPVNYRAEDSMVLDVASSKILLYGKTEVKYTDVKLSAPLIVFDQNSNIVTAHMARDSLGNVKGMAKLVQAQTETVSDSIEFNFKTQKGLTHASFFQQQEIYNFAEKVKKVDPETFFAYKGRFTTCNLDTPHFAFRFHKAKFVNNKLAVTGPIHPEFEGVPVPIYLPFGIFPLKTGRRSGILPPAFTMTDNFGVGLEGLGYYKAFSDYLDAKVWADIYSYGSWRVNLAPSYRKRYRYSGNFTISVQNTKTAFKGDPDYSQSRNFFVTWNHTMDGKARPGVTFSAYVRAGSSKYLTNVQNGRIVNAGTPGINLNSGTNGNYLQPMNFTNQLSSSVSYQRSWAGKPFNLSVNLNHNQNTQTRLVNLNLPDVAFIMNTIYPFRPRESVGAGKWYEKLGVGYNGNVKGQISFYDTSFNFKQLIDTFQWGASHEIPILLSLPPLGPIQLGPNFAYRERWYAQKFHRSWDPVKRKVDTTVNKGFYSAREMSVGLAVSTAFFGTYQARNKEAHVQAIRHVMRPQIGFNYKPDLMEPYYYRTQVDTFGNRRLFSDFDGAIFGPFSPGKSGSIGFGLDNNLEMKVRSPQDSATGGFRKVKLIDGFGITGGYNFLADSFQLSTFNLYARSYLFEKINITANATLDPYQQDPKTGNRINKLAWQGDKFSLGNIASGSLNVSTQFKSKKKDDKKKSMEELAKQPSNDLSQDQVQQQLDYVRRNPAEFADFNIPWSVNIGWSLSFARLLQRDYTYKTQFTSSFNFNGDFNISPKWKVGASGFYDLTTNKLQSLTTFISRDLHCWQMAINIQPVGLYRFFSVSINPKSGLLRDLRINRTRYFYNQ
jgi:LPS-assembly protein